MRLMTDLFAYCAERIPRWNTISISGYHIREAGATAVQEIAFTLANGIAYCRAAIAPGLAGRVRARLSFFFNAHNDFFQEVAKFRAARRCGRRSARALRRDVRGAALRFHAQTGGSTLTAQQPENNVVRVAIQALAAVPAAPSRCTRTRRRGAGAADRALGAARAAHAAGARSETASSTPPTRSAARTSSRRSPTSSRRARELIERIDELGGAVAAIEQGFVQAEIEEAAFGYQQEVERGERVIVGVNRFTEEEPERVELHRLDPEAERRQLERTARVRAERNADEAARRSRRCARRRATREPAAGDARGVARALHRRRDLRDAARRVGNVRRATRPGA